MPLIHDHDTVLDFRLAMPSAKNQRPCLQSHLSKIHVSTRSYTKMWSNRGIQRQHSPTFRAMSRYHQRLRNKRYWPTDIHNGPPRLNSAVPKVSLCLFMQSHFPPFILHFQQQGQRNRAKDAETAGEGARETEYEWLNLE